MDFPNNRGNPSVDISLVFELKKYLLGDLGKRISKSGFYLLPLQFVQKTFSTNSSNVGF